MAVMAVDGSAHIPYPDGLRTSYAQPTAAKDVRTPPDYTGAPLDIIG